MKTDDLLTIEDAAKAMGTTNRRAVYRAIDRARADGIDVVFKAFGRTLIPRTAIKVLERYYFPYYSEAHQKMVKKWGAAGGRQSGITKRKRNATAR